MVWARPCSATRNRMFARSRRPRNPFESRTEVWRQVGLEDGAELAAEVLRERSDGAARAA
jgi:hypothetical protein